jgi:cytochrome c553
VFRFAFAPTFAPAFAPAFALTLAAATAAHAAGDRQERGRYLVEQVGMCSDCHSPRDPTGAFIRSKWLTGAPIVVAPKAPMPWADYAPALAGLPGHYTEAQFVNFLQTGLRPDGSQPNPPMPPYRFSGPDAAAVAAYLKSLRAE